MYAKVLLAIALCCAPAVCALADEAENQFAAAAGHYAAQRWEAAADAFANFAREYPGHPKHAKAMFFAGQSLVQLQRYADAYPVFIELLADEPTGPLARQSLFRAGESAYLSGNFDEAKVRLLQFQTLYPRDKMNAAVLMYEAELAVRAGDTLQARRLYRQSIEHFPDEQPADQCRIALAHLLDLEKQFDAAEVLWREVSGHDHSPWTETALLRLAAKAQAAKQPQQSLDACVAVVQRFPKSPMIDEAQLGRGRALVQLGRYDEAQKVLSTLTNNKEFGNEAGYWIGQAQKAQRQHPTAGTLSAALKGTTNRDNAAPSTSARRTSEATARVADKKSSLVPSTEQSSTSRKSEDERLAPLELAQTQTKSAEIAPEKSADDTTSAELAARQKSADDRRRIAATQYQTAEKFVRSGDYGRAITILQSTDKQADDAPSLANRYLLAVALQGAKRTDESLAVLNEVNLAIGRTLNSATDRSDQSSASSDPHAEEDRTALRVLRTNIFLARATALVAAERFDEAVELLQSYLASGRQDVSAQRAQAALAICLARTKRIDQARKALDDLRAAHPESVLLMPATGQVAEAAFTAGQYAIAAELFTVLASDGNPPEIIARGLAGLGYSRASLGDYAAADRVFAKLLETYPTDPRAADVSLARGQALEHLQREASAAAVYKQAIARFEHAPQLPALLLAQAQLQGRLGQHEEAVGIYQRLARDYPDSPQIDAALYGWAWVLRDLGRGAEADKVFRRLHDDHPESSFWADATFRLAERANERGDSDEALELLTKLLEGDCPAGVRQHALYLQAQIAIGHQEWSQAEKPLEQLVMEFPDSNLRTAAQFWLGEASYRQDDFQAAQPRFEALAASLKNQRESWTAIVRLRRAQILAEQKKWTEAARLAESVGRDFPDFVQQHEADYTIGRCRMAQGDLDGARAAFTRVTRSAAGAKTETAAMAQCMIGDAYFQQENYSAALREYLRVEILHPYPKWQAAALLQASKCHEKLGQTKEAAEMYAHMLQKYPQTQYTADASQQLQDSKRR
jgi:cellulose synthase operon protein C